MPESMPLLRLTTSWDDGHPLDRRVAAELGRRGLPGTFYVPRHNVEGRPVMAAADIRALAAEGFELAAHTSDHVRLPGLSREAARRQIEEGRHWLEDVLGAPVRGFAYPGGHPGPWGRALAREAGFAYARTTRMLCLGPGPDPFAMGTTAQIFHHGLPALLRNWLRHGGGGNRLAVLSDLRSGGGLPAAMAVLFARARRQGGVLHLWGHSWEIEQRDLWAAFDDIMAMAADLVPADGRVTNEGVTR